MVRTNVTVACRRPIRTHAAGRDRAVQGQLHRRPAQVAQKLTNRLADVFVEESSRKREVRAEETSMFIAQQLEASQMRLNELEARLRTAQGNLHGRAARADQRQRRDGHRRCSSSSRRRPTRMRGDAGSAVRCIERQIEAMKSGAGTRPRGRRPPQAISPAAAPRAAPRSANWPRRATSTPTSTRKSCGCSDELAAGPGRYARRVAAARERIVSPRCSARPDLPRAAQRARAGAAARRRAASAGRRTSRRRSECIAPASTRRRASSSRWPRCSASTTWRRSRYPALSGKLHDARDGGEPGAQPGWRAVHRALARASLPDVADLAEHPAPAGAACCWSAAASAAGWRSAASTSTARFTTRAR